MGTPRLVRFVESIRLLLPHGGEMQLCVRRGASRSASVCVCACLCGVLQSEGGSSEATDACDWERHTAACSVRRVDPFAPPTQRRNATVCEAWGTAVGIGVCVCLLVWCAPV